MKTGMSFTKEQRDIAKRDNLPLVTIGYDGRHIAKGHPNGMGSIVTTGPMSMKKTKMVQDFLLKLLQVEGD